MNLALYTMSASNSGAKLADKYFITINLTGGEDVSSKVLIQSKIGFVTSISGAEYTVYGKVVSNNGTIAKIRVRIDDYDALPDSFTFSKLYSELYWREGNLDNIRPQTRDFSNDSPLIFSINPDIITGSSVTAHTLYNNADYNFLIIQRYRRNEPNSEHETLDLRLKETVEANLGQTMLNYIYELQKHEDIKSLTWGFANQMPLGLELTSNSNNKTGSIADGDWAGFYLTVNCAFPKTYSCSYVETIISEGGLNDDYGDLLEDFGNLNEGW
jgi:hypothetical protein